MASYGVEDFVRDYDVSRETCARLEQFAELLKHWNRRVNLVSKDSLNDIWQLHYSLGNDTSHNTTPSRIANLTNERACQGHWIKATVAGDGRSYSITTSRRSDIISYGWR